MRNEVACEHRGQKESEENV